MFPITSSTPSLCFHKINSHPNPSVSSSLLHSSKHSVPSFTTNYHSVKMLYHKLAIILATSSMAALLSRGASPPSSTATITHVTHRHPDHTTSMTINTHRPVPNPDCPDGPRCDYHELCQYTYCDEHDSKWCHYWASVTAYNQSVGPVPAETRIFLGSCKAGENTAV